METAGLLFVCYPLKSPELSAQYFIRFRTFRFHRNPCLNVMAMLVTKLCAQISRSFRFSSAESNAGMYSKPNLRVTS